MRMRALSSFFLLAFLASGGVAHAQEDGECPAGSPTTLVKGIISAVGEKPIWVAVGRDPLVWKGEGEAQTVMWIRDLEATGAIMLSGTNTETGAAMQFAANNTALPRPEKFRLDARGTMPRGDVSQDDLRAYTFHPSAVWFPSAGCYQINAQIGREQAVLHLEIVEPSEP